MRAGLKRTGGNLQALRDAAAQIRRAAGGHRRDDTDALSAGDAATAERAAHSLKGAAGTLGADALSEAAAKAETAIKTGHGVG